MIRYTYDGWDVIRENNSVKGITMYQNGLGIDDKLRSKRGSVIRYFLTDHLGSTEALANASGAIVSSTSYDSFGNATSNIATSYRYTGREYDADTGLYYYRNRWYDPEIGRFISTDPIGFAGGDINLYGYVGNNPLSFIDPYGNYACKQKQDQQDVCKDVKLVKLEGEGSKFILQEEADVEEERKQGLFAPDFAEKFSAALSEINQHGITPQINSGFRNEKDQAGLRRSGAGKNPVARGTSLHQAGYAVDINGTGNPQFKTIRRVMKKHGFSWGGYFKKPDPPHFFMNPFGRKGTKTFGNKLKAAAAAARKYYVDCLKLGK